MLRLLPLVTVSIGEAQAQPSERTTFALTGDSIITRRVSTYRTAGVDEIWRVIREADVAFTNFETLVHNFEYPGEALSGGTYMGSPAWVTDELEWLGIDLVGTANNHTFDYGLEGMRSTERALNASKLVHAGTGRNLALARAPAYLDTPQGRVALIACASTFTPASAAGPQRPDLPGRPGLNPLRFVTTYTVEPETLATLRQFRGGSATGPLKFLGATWEAGEMVGKHTAVVSADLEGMKRSVQHARVQSEWVMVSIHAHESLEPGDRTVPAEFVVEFAHAMIEAGADMVIGHGPHVVRGIEIYQGKPIFYSLGNFIFENELMAYQPAENYESVGLGPDATPSEFYSARSKNDMVSFPSIQGYWESVVAEAEFDAARHIREIRLHPIELGFKQARSKRGQPYPASDDAAERILAEAARTSAAFGTAVAIEDGIGVVRVEP